jgi:alanyl-tRNA synthetase
MCSSGHQSRVTKHKARITGVILLSGNEIREKFLKYFETCNRPHRRVRSSSLVPTNDPTLLFTNAGMNQFKDVFLGLDQREYTRATTSQKCVRAGGKHNDLENVGFTNRHHTFFEMLGNFSFGDYFKKDAIAYAWELITSPNWFGIPVEKLTFTVFGGAEVAPGNILGIDEEALNLWVNVGAPRNRVIPVPGLKENFWAMGDTGPCGPCSEIHYDMGPAASDQGHKDCKFGCECGRYVEIWNLVFMQFNRDASGTVAPLPKPSIDTGAGLERLAAVLQGKISNFDTDLFVPLIDRAAELCGADRHKPENQPSLRIIADHARAVTFLIADGVIPSNEGRGSTLRKIIRRAIHWARKLDSQGPFLFGERIGTIKPFLSDMAIHVVELMTPAYPELRESEARIKSITFSEEQNYARLFAPALERLEDRIRASNPAGKAVLSTSGSDLFFAQDTLGLRPELVQDFVKAKGWTIAHDAELEYEREMEEQRARGRASWKGGHKEAAKPIYTQIAAAFSTKRDFYNSTRASDCRIEAIVIKGTSVSQISEGEEAEIILDNTVIYAESGGQVADVGTFYDTSETMKVAEVHGAYYPIAGLIAHRITAKQELRVGDKITVIADGARREHIKRNHTGTHLMHAALRNILGTHVKQAGSLVEPARLRFDFSHFAAIDPAELRDIEQQVNDEILLNSEIQTNITTLDDALASGALAFFGDRYPEQNVRVVSIPDPSSPRGFYSKELCGGTHVRRTGDIGVFKIVVEQSAAAGVRRIEAITGAAALADYQRAQQLLREINTLMGVNEEFVIAAIQRSEQAQRQLEKQLETMKRKGALSKLDELASQARTIKGVKVISAELEGVDREAMRQLVDSLRQKLGSGVVVLGTVEDGKVALLAGVTKDLTSKLHAGKIIQAIAKEVGGSGGGRPDLAEAGGKDTPGLKMALDHVYPLIDQLL